VSLLDGRTPLSATEIYTRVREELVHEGVPRLALDLHWQRFAGADLLSTELLVDGSLADLLGDFSPAGVRNLRQRVYLRPATTSRNKLMDMAHQLTRDKGIKVCCSRASLSHW